MDILYILASISVVLFMVLATYDGFYLHLIKFGLFNKQESLFEHKTHTARAILFPLIVWFLFVNETSYVAFQIGIILVLLDLIVMAVDAYSETESRSFMGGLPRWEYIVHLFSNGFHFAAIILVIALKLKVTGSTVIFVGTNIATEASTLFHFLSVNIIPGAIVLALLHVLLLLEKPKAIWNIQRAKITCC